jgi:hypothetical protein
MAVYDNDIATRNRNANTIATVRIVRRLGPRFIRGHRSTRLTAVWTIRLRQLSAREVLV